MTALLDVKDLTVRFEGRHCNVTAIDKLSFAINPGECVGIVGESGSGKSQTFLNLLGLKAANAQVSGSALFNGQEIINAPAKVMRTLRGNQISMIFQDSITGLTPHLKIGAQLEEVLMEHQNLSRAKARTEVLEMLEVVQIPEATRRLQMYPHELSGGMRQRVMIAMALLCKPKVLIADEPTTALDVTVQARILHILRKLKMHTDMAIFMITHDLGVIAGLCDRVIVMYAGRAVEMGTVDDIFYRPQHPYTRALLQSIPRLDADPDLRLLTIPGTPPSLAKMPAGCAFAPRCSEKIGRCETDRPDLTPRDGRPDHRAACYLGEHAA
ncbi:ABC transporter ATP-binding protein [Govanella unica]|uniref:ATP-binding cassette domain-containing protein n=1 Tax=Govanella unica TaxID=2975056 RepID=A0A9X3Z6G3_9PROT|nr:oligopeptide/dipeptide ABC transporter ATP-binding protein [Govania unica]MDA5192904.1 ATP-binding cassette domain-containing protein [Govania unica]